ncbi:hypothetical protein DK880_00492 [Candidatus Cardinium hertigii]|uniref:Uncharacterized protein n=1 Tax=Candidatus Cardinium hertigii TaxID=247481 RepID=A0A2Z3LHA4_9BACT|nr:hypothetical protein DK880_00492 [Candidatus Cardinium hertigii]
MWVLESYYFTGYDAIGYAIGREVSLLRYLFWGKLRGGLSRTEAS